MSGRNNILVKSVLFELEILSSKAATHAPLQSSCPFAFWLPPFFFFPPLGFSLVLFLVYLRQSIGEQLVGDEVGDGDILVLEV